MNTQTLVRWRLRLKKKPKTSAVWDHFKLVEDKEKTPVANLNIFKSK